MTVLPLPPNKTKIVCTIGPASESPEILEKLILNGMNVARLNFAHGDFTSHERAIRNIRSAATAVDRRVAIMADLPGPKMRIGNLDQESIWLKRGQSFTLTTEHITGDEERVSVTFGTLPNLVEPGDRIYVNDGFILLVVESVRGHEIHCQVEVGGELRSHKGVNIPAVDLGISAFTEKDHDFLKFAAQQGLDAISQSFVQNQNDIYAVREAAAQLAFEPFIIAKIERAGAVENLDKILDAADGLMVARGDLGVEIPIEEMAVVQKDIIRQANQVAKPVITATHMLESMTAHSRPTRAEATDVANAILDGTDCVMLSGETATGLYPIEAVMVMCRIAAVTEPYRESVEATKALELARNLNQTSRDRRVSLSIYLSAEAIDPMAIAAPTFSGSTPRLITRYRLPVWIFAFCMREPACQRLQFSYGVFPIDMAAEPEDWGDFTRDCLREYGFTEGLALLNHGHGTDSEELTNTIEIIELTDIASLG